MLLSFFAALLLLLALQGRAAHEQHCRGARSAVRPRPKHGSVAVAATLQCFSDANSPLMCVRVLVCVCVCVCACLPLAEEARQREGQGQQQHAVKADPANRCVLQGACLCSQRGRGVHGSPRFPFPSCSTLCASPQGLRMPHMPSARTRHTHVLSAMNLTRDCSTHACFFRWFPLPPREKREQCNTPTPLQSRTFFDFGRNTSKTMPCFEKTLLSTLLSSQ